MRRIVLLLALVGVVLATGSCKDTELRTDLNAYHQALEAWQTDVYEAVCQLESDVYDLPDSAGDQRLPGPVSDRGSNRLCKTGPGDPDGRPPKPPEL